MTLLALLLLGLLAAGPVAANTITVPLTFEDSAGVPLTLEQAVDVAGDSVYLLFDLGTAQEWTSPANSQLSENLLFTVLSLGGDSASIAELFQPGAVFAGFTEGPSAPANVPEPATLILLSGALGLLSFCGLLTCAARKDPRNVPLQRTD